MISPPSLPMIPKLCTARPRISGQAVGPNILRSKKATRYSGKARVTMNEKRSKVERPCLSIPEDFEIPVWTENGL